MRHTKVLLASLALAAAGALFSGCASHTTNDGKNHTVVLGGLYESHDGAYSQQTSTGIPLNGEKALPGARMSGNKTSFLWGLFTSRDQ